MQSSNIASPVTFNKNLHRISRLSSRQRANLLNAVLNKQATISQICDKYSISRPTFYKWLSRYTSSSGSQFSLLNKNNSFRRSCKHPLKKSDSVEKELVQTVLAHPDWSCSFLAKNIPNLSIGTAQNILKKRGLNTYAMRLAFHDRYFATHPSIKEIAPSPIVSRWFIPSLLQTVRRHIPTGMASPPPAFLFTYRFLGSLELSLFDISKLLRKTAGASFDFLSSFSFKSKFSIVRKVSFSLASFVLVAGIILINKNLLSETKSTSSAVGLLLSEISLLFGTFFFLYSIRYYLSLALVMLFSRHKSPVSGTIKTGDTVTEDGQSKMPYLDQDGNNASLEEFIPEIVTKPSLQPFVSIQLPYYNEKKVAERSIRASAAQDYIKFEVLVCDDSTDETVEIVNRVSAEINQEVKIKITKAKEELYQSLVSSAKEGKTQSIDFLKRLGLGVTFPFTALTKEQLNQLVDDAYPYSTLPVGFQRVRILHRPTRSGFKGAALGYALKAVYPSTKYIVVLDADFVPFADTILQFLKYYKLVSYDEKYYSKQVTGDWSLVTGGEGNEGNRVRDTSNGILVTGNGIDASVSRSSLPVTRNLTSISYTEANRLSGGDWQERLKYSNLAAVQGYQWHILNKNENWVTRGVRTEYSGSYIVERSSDEILGSLKQISGSVYMIRREPLEQVGWKTSITEDFQLTLRLYERGYKVAFTPYIQAPSECVSTLKRLIRQRMRWAEGHSHNIKEMFFPLIKSNNLTWVEKLQVLYLSPYYLQAAFFMVGNICWFLAEIVFRVRLPFWSSLWGWSLVFSNLFALPLMNGVGMFVEEAEEKDYLGLLSFILLCYLVLPFQAWAAVKGFFEKEEGTWFRTPKTGNVTIDIVKGSFSRLLGLFKGASSASFKPVSASSFSLNKESLSNLSYLPAYVSDHTAYKNFYQLTSLGTVSHRIRGLAPSLIAGLSIFSILLFYFTPFVPTRSDPTGSNRFGIAASAHELPETMERQSVWGGFLEHSNKNDANTGSASGVSLIDNRAGVGNGNQAILQRVLEQNPQLDPGYSSGLRVAVSSPMDSPDNFFIKDTSLVSWLINKLSNDSAYLTGGSTLISHWEKIRQTINTNQSGLEISQQKYLPYYAITKQDGSVDIYNLTLRGLQRYSFASDKKEIVVSSFDTELSNSKSGSFSAYPRELAISKPIFQYQAANGDWLDYIPDTKVENVIVEQTDSYIILDQKSNLFAPGSLSPLVSSTVRFKLGYFEEAECTSNLFYASKLTFILGENSNINRLTWDNDISHGNSAEIQEGGSSYRFGDLHLDWSDFGTSHEDMDMQAPEEGILDPANSLVCHSITNYDTGAKAQLIFYPEGKMGELEIDPTLSLATSASTIQIDVPNKYKAVFDTSVDATYDTFLSFYDRAQDDSSPDKVGAVNGTSLFNNSSPYYFYLTYDPDRTYTVLESSSTRVKVRVAGRLLSSNGTVLTDGATALSVSEEYTFTTEGVFQETLIDFKTGLELPTDYSYSGLHWLPFDFNYTDGLHSETIIYGNGSVESSQSSDGEIAYTNKYVVIQGNGSYQDMILGIPNKGRFDQPGVVGGWYYDVDDEGEVDWLYAREQGITPVGEHLSKYYIFFKTHSDLDTLTERADLYKDLANPDNLSFTTGSAWGYEDDSSLEGLWYMESDGSTGETDYSTRGNDLAVSASDTIPASSDAMQGSYSRDFELGDSDYLYISDASQTGLDPNGNFTITGWIKKESQSVDQHVVTKANNTSNQRSYLLGVNSSGQYYWNLSGDGINYTQAYTTAVVSTSVWSHFAVTYDGSYTRIYVNGALSSNGSNNPKSYSSGVFDTTAAFQIGSRDGGSYPFDGLIDEVAFFSRSLNPDEVFQIYKNTVRGHYDFSEGAYSIDASPSANLSQASRVAFDIDGATYPRHQPLFKISSWNDTRLPAAVTLEGATIHQGTSYNASLKPFSEAWYEDGGSSTKIADGGDITDSDEYLNNPSNTYTLTGYDTSDTLYLGSNNKFTGVNYILDTQGVDASASIDWEYWDGNSWEDLAGETAETAGSDKLTTTNGSFYFTKPLDWAAYTLTTTELGGSTTGERELYWIRGTAGVGYDTAPVIRQAWTDILLFHYLGKITLDNQTFTISSAPIIQSVSSIQIDVPNRYRVVMDTGDTSDYLLIYDRAEDDSNPDNTYEFLGPYIYEGGAYYMFRYHATRKTTVLESSSVRVRVRVEGCFDTEAGGACLGSTDFQVTEEYTFTTEGIYVYNKTDFNTNSTIALDSPGSNENGYNFLMIDGDFQDNAFGNTLYYGDGETESNATTDTSFQETNLYAVFPAVDSSGYQSSMIGIQQAGWMSVPGATDGWRIDFNTFGTRDRLFARTGGVTPIGAHEASWYMLLRDENSLDSEAEREALFNDNYNPDSLSFTAGSEWSLENDPDLEGLWYMESDGSTGETDHSTRGNDLAVSASDTIPASSDARQGNYSRDFETNDADYMYISDNDQVGLNQTGPFSITGWFKTESNSKDLHLVSKLSADGNRSHLLGIDTEGYLYWYVSDDGSSLSLAYPSQTVSINSWAHFAIVYDGVYQRIYVDGIFSPNGSNNPKSHSSGIFDSTAAFMIGARDGSTLGAFDGLIDEVAFFSRALAPSEISQIYKRGMSEHYNEGEGTYDIDSSGNQVQFDIDGDGNVSNLLNGAVAFGDASITVYSTTGFSSSGSAYIDGDYFTYTGITGTTFTGIPAFGEASVIEHVDGTVVSQSNRHQPIFKMRGYRENFKPLSISMEGVTLVEGADYNVDHKPLTGSYFADELLWASTLQSATAFTSPDIGDGTSSSVDTATFVSARYGNGMQVDASTENPYIVSSGNINGTSGIIDFWFKETGTPAAAGYFFACNDGSGTTNMSLGRGGNDTDIDFVVDDGSAHTNSWDGISVPVYDGLWHHIKVTYDSATDVPDLYLDGILQTRDATSAWNAITPQTNLYFGNDNDGNEIAGILDEFHIHSPSTDGLDTLASGGDNTDSAEYLFDEDTDYTLDFEAVDASKRGEYLFFGSDSVFTGLNVDLETVGVSSAADLYWQYWDGTSWASLESVSGFTDGTNHLTQDGSVYWSITPANWRSYSVNGSTDLYWIRASLASGSYTTSPVENTIKTDILLIQYLSDITSADQTLIIVPEKLWWLFMFIPLLPLVIKKKRDVS